MLCGVQSAAARALLRVCALLVLLVTTFLTSLSVNHLHVLAPVEDQVLSGVEIATFVLMFVSGAIYFLLVLLLVLPSVPRCFNCLVKRQNTVLPTPRLGHSHLGLSPSLLTLSDRDEPPEGGVVPSAWSAAFTCLLTVSRGVLLLTILVLEVPTYVLSSPSYSGSATLFLLSSLLLPPLLFLTDPETEDGEKQESTRTTFLFSLGLVSCFIVGLGGVVGRSVYLATSTTLAVSSSSVVETIVVGLSIFLIGVVTLTITSVEHGRSVSLRRTIGRVSEAVATLVFEDPAILALEERPGDKCSAEEVLLKWILQNTRLYRSFLPESVRNAGGALGLRLGNRVERPNRSSDSTEDLTEDDSSGGGGDGSQLPDPPPAVSVGLKEDPGLAQLKENARKTRKRSDTPVPVYRGPPRMNRRAGSRPGGLLRAAAMANATAAAEAQAEAAMAEEDQQQQHPNEGGDEDVIAPRERRPSLLDTIKGSFTKRRRAESTGSVPSPRPGGPGWVDSPRPGMVPVIHTRHHLVAGSASMPKPMIPRLPLKRQTTSTDVRKLLARSPLRTSAFVEDNVTCLMIFVPAYEKKTQMQARTAFHERVSRLISRFRGSVHNWRGGKLFCTFNSSLKCTDHEKNASHAGLLIVRQERRLAKEDPPISCSPEDVLPRIAISCGVAFHGHGGSQSLGRSFEVFGEAVSRVEFMTSRYCLSGKWTSGICEAEEDLVVVDENVFRVIRFEFQTRVLDHDRDRQSVFHELLNVKDSVLNSRDNEWLYVIREEIEGKNSPSPTEEDGEDTDSRAEFCRLGWEAFGANRLDDARQFLEMALEVEADVSSVSLQMLHYRLEGNGE